MENKKLTIQEYISLGYLYIIVLGLIVDVIYYKFLGINILSYSTILDVMITPVYTLTRDFKIFLVICIFLGMAIYYLTNLAPKIHEFSKRKGWYSKKVNIEKIDKKYSKKTTVKDLVILLALLVFGLFLGLSLGSGPKMKSKLVSGDFELNHIITFQDNSQKKVKIIGQNSNYIFYVEKGDVELVVSPIFQNVKTIQKMTKKKIDENSK